MSDQIKCSICNGKGVVNWWRAKCRRCNGSGLRHPPNHACPQCGSMIINYGGDWACAGMHCQYAPHNIVCNNGSEPEWWHDGTKVYMDGNMWCAVGPEFEDLQVSPAGFGKTPELAVIELRREVAA